MNEKESIRYMMDTLKLALSRDNDLMVRTYLKAFNISNVEELKEIINIIETFDYDTEITQKLLGNVNAKFLISLVSVFSRNIINQLLKIEKSKDR